MAKIGNKANADKDMKHIEIFIIADGNAKWYSYFGRQVGVFLRN